jgi:hypothetical protein
MCADSFESPADILHGFPETHDTYMGSAPSTSPPPNIGYTMQTHTFFIIGITERKN